MDTKRRSVCAGTATSSTASSSVIHHFIQNFELSGFGSPGEALVQTVKELVDNAMDACRWRGMKQDPPTVKVVLRRVPPSQASSSTPCNTDDGIEMEIPERDDRLELQVTDNGAGLADVTKALLLFSSTKSGHGLEQGTSAGPNAGKYGLGMTLSLLYSQVTFGGFIKVMSTTVNSTQYSFTRCRIDLKTGQPAIVYSKTGAKPAHWAEGCGTDIRLLVPGREDALDYAKPRLQTLFGRMHLLFDRAAGVTLECEGCLDKMCISVPRGGRECSPHLLVNNGDLVRAFAAGMVSMRKVHEGATTICESQSTSINSQGGGAEHAQRSEPNQGDVPQKDTRQKQNAIRGEDVAVFECEAKSGTRVSAAITLERPSRTTAKDDAYHQVLSGETIVPLLVHRFVNGMPMLDTNTSSACALVVGVSKSGWRGLGLKISTSRVHHREGRLRFVLSEAPTPLKVKGGAAWSALANVSAVHVSLSVQSENVPYTNLRKDAIAHKEGYVSATASAVGEGLASLANREQGGFRSAAKAAKEMMEQDFIPLMASSIAAMVEGSGDVSFQRKCLDVLGVGSEYAHQKRLQNVIQHELRQTIREMEENRARGKALAAERRAIETHEEREMDSRKRPSSQS